MIARWIVFFFAVAVTYSLDFECIIDAPNCSCRSSQNDDYEIYCDNKNNSSFIVNFQPHDYVQITCQNWSNLKYFDLTTTLPGKKINSLLFRMCLLPENSSIANVARQLGIEKIQYLLFQSFQNLSNHLTRQQLQDFPDIKKLILSSNGLSEVPSDLFADIPNLNWLDLHENNLILPSGIFDLVPKLEVLELGNNEIDQIEIGMFDKLEKLRLLNLWRNQLSEVKPGLFDKLVSLKSLDINSNKLTTLPANIFSKLKKLDTLYLFRNNFSSLPEGLFKENKELRVVKLNNNNRNITTLPHNLFANLTNLDTVMLSRMGLWNLPENMFWGASSLANIHLDRNFLVTLPKDIFRDVTNLTMLDLYLNNIETLPDGIFANAGRLVKLNLSRNRMTFISKHLFQGLKFLKELNMEDNRLQTIHFAAFSSLHNLSIAKFSYNQLTLQTPDSQKFKDLYGSNSPFNKCSNLKELDLSHNKISEIFSDWTISDTHLQLLNLSYNGITSIAITDLQFVSNNIRVDLTHNKITQVNLHGAEFVAEYQKDPRDVIILIENNPIICDCVVYDLLLYLDGRMHPYVQNYMHINPGNLKCKSPEWLEDVEISKLNSKTLTCMEKENYNETTCENCSCPTDCTCWIRPDDTARIIDCSYKNLTEISIPKLNYKTIEGYHVELNFTGNALKEIPSFESLGSEYVTVLRLSHNYITDVPLEKLPENLEILELDNNNISTINPEVLDYLKNSTVLEKLTLHKNPWKCDCDNRDLLSFIQLMVTDIPDLLQVTCDGMNTFMSEMTVNEFCPVDTMMLVAISLAISLTGLFIGGLVALYYRYQQEIKVWLYAHQFCLWFVTEDELDKDKTYDAFISYSHKDEDFVVNDLVPILENGPRPYKLCLHFRDWLAGEWIPTQITRSVEQSRRTIVIVSPNFLESVWGAMEFRAAHRQAMSEGRARVILILYGDIGPTENLDAEFKAYLSMNTYVKWGDPWFWDKLRYALPHSSEFTRYAKKKRLYEKHYPCIQINSPKELIYPHGVPETPPATTTPPADSLKVFICDPNEKDFHTTNDENEVSKLNANNKHDIVPQYEAIHKQLIDKIQCTTV